jgi:hypothetical protein
LGAFGKLDLIAETIQLACSRLGVARRFLCLNTATQRRGYRARRFLLSAPRRVFPAL